MNKNWKWRVLKTKDCFICLHQPSCLKVVELKASQKDQASTLFLLLKLVQSDSELFSQFVSQDCHKLLLKVLQSPRCIAGHHMLKVGKHCLMNGISVSLSLQANIGIMSLKRRLWKSLYHILCSSIVHITTWHYHHFTNWHWTSLAHLLHISEVLSLNLGQETGYPDWRYHAFPQSLQADARMVPQVRPQSLPSTSFSGHYSWIILSFSVVKQHELCTIHMTGDEYCGTLLLCEDINFCMEVKLFSEVPT